MTIRHGRVVGILLAAIILCVPAGLKADFAVFRAPSHIISLFALPGETIPFDFASYSGMLPDQLDRYRIETTEGVGLEYDGDARFLLTAPPEAGIYPVRFQEVLDDPALPEPEAYRVQVVVMRPAEEAVSGRLNGYPVGVYPRDDRGEPWSFQQPRGFVEITLENRNTLLTDHFTLAEMECKLEAEFPRYASIHTSLLIKLEGIADELLQRGLPGDHIKILSGFRTPEYNRSIGNRTRFSRHIVGDAADIFVDADGDDRMDDLTGDGRINRRDSQLLLAIVDDMDASDAYAPLVGGASAYRGNGNHGPFLHVDTRGYLTRW